MKYYDQEGHEISEEVATQMKLAQFKIQGGFKRKAGWCIDIGALENVEGVSSLDKQKFIEMLLTTKPLSYPDTENNLDK